MYLVLVLAVFVAVASADSEDMKKKCHRLEHPGVMHCCKSGFTLPDINVDEVRECLEMPHNPHTCEPFNCIGKKRGYVSADGTVDKEAFARIMSEDFKDMPTLVEAIQQNCINGDLAKFGPPDACELMKLKLCVHHKSVFQCNDWDDNGPCSGIKDMVKECAEMDS